VCLLSSLLHSYRLLAAKALYTIYIMWCAYCIYFYVTKKNQSATMMSFGRIIVVVIITRYIRIVFTQGLRVVLEFHQHSAAEKLTREIQQVGVIKQHDEFLEFSGHDDFPLTIRVRLIRADRAAAVMMILYYYNRFRVSRYENKLLYISCRHRCYVFQIKQRPRCYDVLIHRRIS